MVNVTHCGIEHVQACVRRAVAQHHAVNPAAGSDGDCGAGGAAAADLVHAAARQIWTLGGARIASFPREHPLRAQGMQCSLLCIVLEADAVEFTICMGPAICF